MVLSQSQYPHYFPQSFDLDYNPTNNILIVDYELPAIGRIPTLKEVKYIRSRDEFDEKQISQSQLNKLYDGILYQITLRSIRELFTADESNSIFVIVFNCMWVSRPIMASYSLMDFSYSHSFCIEEQS